MRAAVGLDEGQVIGDEAGVDHAFDSKRSGVNAGDLADAVGMEPSAVSHQLRQLRHLGLVVGERRGKHVIYDLHDPHVAELLDQAVFHVQHLQLGAARAIGVEAEVS